MTHLLAYFTFNGNCRQAMTFYQRCLGGELYLQSVKDSPMSAKLPQYMQRYVLHSCLRRESLMIMGTDMVGEQGLKMGNAISVMIECSSEEELREYYKNLSEGGYATHPLEPTSKGSLFGALTDRFGHQWLLSLNERCRHENQLKNM